MYLLPAQHSYPQPSLADDENIHSVEWLLMVINQLINPRNPFLNFISNQGGIIKICFAVQAVPFIYWFVYFVMCAYICVCACVCLKFGWKSVSKVGDCILVISQLIYWSSEIV